jgi:hypothetical protein
MIVFFYPVEILCEYIFETEQSAPSEKGGKNIAHNVFSESKIGS